MFERKFKFVVDYPHDVCNKRLIKLQTELIESPYRSSYSKVMADSPHYRLSEIQTSILGRHTIRATINTTPVQGGKSYVTGIAHLERFGGISIIDVMAVLAGIILIVLAREVLFLSIVGIGTFHSIINTAYLVHERNKLIKKIEIALTQPKKKKN